MDDRGLYAPGQLWLQREDILGRAKGTLRYLGMVTIILNDYPVLKYVLIGINLILCFLVYIYIHIHCMHVICIITLYIHTYILHLHYIHTLHLLLLLLYRYNGIICINK